MTQTSPYLLFNGNCAEAMSFYKDCLGGELFMQKISDSPMANDFPPALREGILHASLNNGGIVLLASDMANPNPAPAYSPVNISLSCSTKEEMAGFYEKLSAGGKKTRPPHEFFAGTIGALTDKYGMEWILYFGNN